jgi:hypothetical protein
VKSVCCLRRISQPVLINREQNQPAAFQSSLLLIVVATSIKPAFSFPPDTISCMNALKHLPFLLLPLLCGCGQNSAIREYEVERESEKVLTSDVLRDQFEAVPFRWSVPKDWQTAENDQFSAFAWTTGPSDASARITVSDLPGTAGVEPQFVRWRGQLQLPEIDPAELMKTVETVALKGFSGQFIEIKGESESIMGMIAAYKDKLWVLKYRSANSTADAQRASFRAFCESLTAE